MYIHRCCQCIMFDIEWTEEAISFAVMCVFISRELAKILLTIYLKSISMINETTEFVLLL